ncbi:MAG: class I SAM-dependent rRNA methyltransferase [Ginsengibacter sp.]
MFQEKFPEMIPERLAIKLTPDGERILKQQKHPWIFSESIRKINKEGKAGDIAIVFDLKSNAALGVGLFDPESPIRIKMLHFGGGRVIDNAFFKEKISFAFSKREALLSTNTNSYRLIFGENDGFPGFIADVYADVLVVKLYSAIWLPFLKMILESLKDVSGCTCIVLRLSRNLQALPDLGLKDGEILYGDLKNEEVEFKEYGIRFLANVMKGHKTGFFLDHRANRKKVGELSKNKRVLDVFSYAGGFSVHALVNGAKDVTSVDISAQALEIAKINAGLNPFSGKHHTIAGDAFEVLKSFIEKKEVFDIVVIDPPSFAKAKNEIAAAKRKYAQLATLGAQLTAFKGMLVLASCTSRVTTEEFYTINEEAFKLQHRKVSLIDKTGHDIDHPVTFKEGSYLKCGYYQFD